MKAYSLHSYSMPALLSLLVAARGESVRLEAGLQPYLKIKGRQFEIDGPVVDDEIAEELLRAVASTRQMRALRERATVDIIYRRRNSRFLIRAVRAFGVFRLELHVLRP